MSFEIGGPAVIVPPQSLEAFESGKEVLVEIHSRRLIFPGTRITCRSGLTEYRAEVISVGDISLNPGYLKFKVKKV